MDATAAFLLEPNEISVFISPSKLIYHLNGFPREFMDPDFKTPASVFLPSFLLLYPWLKWDPNGTEIICSSSWEAWVGSVQGRIPEGMLDSQTAFLLPGGVS